ncbi:SMP-30/gluconolactonase/LRE family protein [Microbacterium sp. ZW T5_56]|uniref:SMP-30/gluconolactonase/LRE family protein n=1 Tax=Microbacterium sp. ZW T5_56 TaxID=3378081 RepID=UPI0038555622
MRAEQVTAAVAEHGEGPVWWPGWGGLRFVDGSRGDVLTLLPGGDVARMHVDAFTGFLRPRSNGGWVVGGEHALLGADDPQTIPVELVRLLNDPTIRLNDAGTDRAGRLYAGSMAYEGTTDAAQFWRITGDDVRVQFSPVTVSNGFDTSPDGSLGYYVDTATGRVDVCDVTPDGLVDRRPFAVIDPVLGHPDGLTVAADGSVWVALWDGHGVLGFDANGVLRERIEVPTARTTACAFGGDDLRTLYITSSRQGITDDPLAGALFAATPGVTGLPVTPYAG